MSTRLYVGSLPYSATDLALKQIFDEAGVVLYAKIIKNKETNLSRGFGFVEMATIEEAEAALKLNGSQYKDRSIIVKEAISITDIQNSNSKEGNNDVNS